MKTDRLHAHFLPLLRSAAALVAAALASSSSHAWPGGYPSHRRSSEVELAAPIQVASAGTIEVAFSPNESSMALVVKVIDSARLSIHMLAYNLTSPRVVQALIRARQRDVAVHVVVDEKQNVDEDRYGKSHDALSSLVRGGADVRVTRAFLDHHDKSLVVDSVTSELGSLNFSESAAQQNSEVALVNWNNPSLASALLKHFERNYARSRPYAVR